MGVSLIKEAAKKSNDLIDHTQARLTTFTEFRNNLTTKGMPMSSVMTLKL